MVSRGDLQQRAPVEDSDKLAWLGREFNMMADSLAGMVGEVSAQRERLETVINCIDDGIVVLHSDRTIIAANDAFVSRIGTSREEEVGNCCYELGKASCNLPDGPTLAYLRSGVPQVKICEHRDANLFSTSSASRVRPGLHANYYKHQDFVKEIRRLTNEDVDVIFDPIGGDHLWQSRKALRSGGSVVGYGLTTSLRGQAKSCSFPMTDRSIEPHLAFIEAFPDTSEVPGG